MKLTPEQYVTLQDAAVSAGLDFRDDYSGRGMYGKTCVGVTGSTPDLVGFVLNVADEDRELADHLASMATDSMGLDRIFYWPGLTMEGNDHE